MRARTAFCSHPSKSSSKRCGAVLERDGSRRHRGRSSPRCSGGSSQQALSTIKASQLRVLLSDERCEVQSAVVAEAMEAQPPTNRRSSSMIVRNGIWRELEAPSVSDRRYRRNLQRALSRAIE